MDEGHMNESQAKGAAKPRAGANPIQIVAITLSSVAIVGMGIMFLTKEEPKPTQESPASLQIGTQANVVTNEEDAAAFGINEATSFTTFYQRDIYVTNGKEASCMIGNDASNHYENTYIQIYLNDENDGLAEELYVSQIIPRGSHIESFTMNRELEPGDYRGTLVYSTLDEQGTLVGDTMFVVEIHVQS